MLSQKEILAHYFSIYNLERFLYNFWIKPILFLEKASHLGNQLFYTKLQDRLQLNANKTVYFSACIIQFFDLLSKDWQKGIFKYLKMLWIKFIYFIFYQANKRQNLLIICTLCTTKKEIGYLIQEMMPMPFISQVLEKFRYKYHKKQKFN